MSKDYFALYESPNIVIVPTGTSTTGNDLPPTGIGAAITESSIIQQTDTEEPETQCNLFLSDRHVPTSVVGGNNCVDTSIHFDNLKNLPLTTSTQHEVTVSHSKYSSHNNLVDLTSSSNLNTNETPSNFISSLNIDQIIDNCEDIKPIEEKEWGSRDPNNLVTKTYSNTVTNNNMNPIKESNSTEKEFKHMNKHEKSNSRNTISKSPKKRSYHESNSDNSRNPENEKEIGLKERKVLKAVSINKKNDSDQKSIHNKSEYISKHNLNNTKSTSIAQKLDQKCERKSASPNKEFLHATLSDAQKSKLSAGALKRYLDYQRFLAKYYNTVDKKQCINDKNTNPCNKDLKLSYKSISNNSLKHKHKKLKKGSAVELKHKESNVKANVERIKNSSRESDITPNIERKQNKEESKRKSYEDKRESSEQSTSRNERQNKKEELLIKFTRYCGKKKKKSIEGHLGKNKIETDKRFAQCSDRKHKKKHDDENDDSSKYKLQKEKPIRKSYDNSEIKRMKEDTNRKENKTKESGVKRKITGSEQESMKKHYKRDSSTIIGSCQSNSDIESHALPIRTVDVIEKTNCYNRQSTDKNDLRSKLSRKRTKNRCNTESNRIKLTPTRENLIVTVKQDVLAAPSANVQSVSKEEVKKSKVKKNVQPVSKKETKKPKVKKSKNIKLVINIKCPNSDDSDGNASEISTSPHQDLSFLDDLDIDGIVESLNAGQSPIRDSDIGTEEDLNRSNKCDNNFNISTGPPAPPCPPASLHEPHLLRNAGKSKGFIANADKSQLSAPHTNENIVEECNDDVYEVIDITDDSDLEDVEETSTNITEDMSIIYINDDSLEGTELNQNNVVISENTENVQNISAEENKQDITNITDIVDNETKLKYLVTQTALVDSSARAEDAVETKYAVQEVSKIKNSNIKIDSNTESDKTLRNGLRVKSENLEEQSASNVRELIPNDVQNTSKTIKNEKNDGIIVKTEDIEKSQKVLTPSSSIQEHVNNDIANTMVNTKIEPIENFEQHQNVATSNSNVREQIRNGVDNTLKNMKKEQMDVIVKTEDQPSNIQEHNTVTNTITKPISNMQTAITIKSENSSVPVQPNIDEINNAKVMTAENVQIIKEDKVIKPNSASSNNDGNPNKQSTEITLANNNKPKDSEKLEAKNTKTQAKPDDVITSKSILTTSSNIQEHIKNNEVDNSAINTVTERIIKESSSSITKVSEDKAVLVKSNTASGKNEGNPNKHSAEITVANNNKPKGSEKLEAKNTKKQAKPDDVIVPKSILTTSSNIQEHNMNKGVDNTTINTTERIIEESSSSMKKVSDDKAVLVKPDTASSKNEGNSNKHSAEITVGNKNLPKDSEKSTKKQTKHVNNVVPKSILITSTDIQEHNINNTVDNTVVNKTTEPIANMDTDITIKSKSLPVPIQRNIDLKNDGINLTKVMTAENAEIIKESSSIKKISEDKVIKQDSVSIKNDKNPTKHSAEITVAKKDKPRDSEKLEAINTKKQAKPGDVIVPKSKIGKTNPINEGANFKNNILNMYTDDKIKKNIAKVLNKKIPKKVKPAKTEIVTPMKSGAKANTVYLNKIEQRMFEYLQRPFSIIQLIHTGYFSSIYTCKDDKGGIYAIKVLKRKFQSMSIYKDKMLTDLQKNSDRDRYFLLEMINNFNIHGQWCFLTEYYPKTLAEILGKGNKKNRVCFHIDVVQNLSRQLVAAVCTLTSNLLVHSDIKPAHILINSSQTRLKLCGFDRMDYSYNIKIIPSTGTASYRAPEIIMGFEADYKIDVWSTALVMFEMASGFKLFPGCFNNDILFKQISTLGPMPFDMIENSSLAFMYFYGTKFMKQIGTSDWIFVPFTDENYRVHKGPTSSYHKTWAPSRSHLQITEDLDKIEMLHRLLQIMLVMDPRHRIPITYVAADEFIFHNDMIPY